MEKHERDYLDKLLANLTSQNEQIIKQNKEIHIGLSWLKKSFESLRDQVRDTQTDMKWIKEKISQHDDDIRRLAEHQHSCPARISYKENAIVKGVAYAEQQAEKETIKYRPVGKRSFWSMFGKPSIPPTNDPFAYRFFLLRAIPYIIGALMAGFVSAYISLRDLVN
jgi:hypothetical protein